MLQLQEALGEYKLNCALVKVDVRNELLLRGDEMLLVAKSNLEEWVGLAIVVVDNLATLAADAGLETDEILHVELIIILLLLLDEYLATHEPLLGAALGVNIVELHNGTRLSAALERRTKERNREFIHTDKQRFLHLEVVGERGVERNHYATLCAEQTAYASHGDHRTSRD